MTLPTSAPVPPVVVASHDFEPRCFALVPCAGVGARAQAGGPKQYQPVAGQAVVAHTLKALAAVPGLDSTLVVLSPDDAQFEQSVPQWADWRVQVARVGGDTRADSVLAGLDALFEQGAAQHDWVLVHDAARCLIDPAWVVRLIEACQDDMVGGLLALPLADTLKEADVDEAGSSRVARTVSRAGKWAAQTPQMFRLGLLRPALRAALSDPETAASITDEASAIELAGHAPLLVPGAWDNLKVTWPEDFALAERLLRAR